MGKCRSKKLIKLQQRINYEFKDPALLLQAVTHKSFSKQHNERLEFVGDAVLGYLIGSLLFSRYPDVREDALSLMRASLVQGKTLAEVAGEIDLAPFLRLGEGERKSGGRNRTSILSDAFEAVIGAVHEDSGIEACADIVQLLFAERIKHINDHSLADLKDAKTQLQEYLQAHKLGLPEYRVEEVSGADHQRTYLVICEVAKLKQNCSATGKSRRAAEKAAAAAMLASLLKQKT